MQGHGRQCSFVQDEIMVSHKEKNRDRQVNSSAQSKRNRSMHMAGKECCAWQKKMKQDNKEFAQGIQRNSARIARKRKKKNNAGQVSNIIIE